MSLVTGEELADALDHEYVDPTDAVFDQVAQAADDIVGALITTGAYELEPAACKEAALAVALEPGVVAEAGAHALDRLADAVLLGGEGEVHRRGVLRVAVAGSSGSG